MAKSVLSTVFIIFISIIIAICLIMTVWLIPFTLGDDRMGKNDIFDYVMQNQEIIETGITDFLQQHPDVRGYEISGNLSLPPSNGIQEITLSDKIVSFYCGGYGMGPATGYTGFYYLLPGGEISIDTSTNTANMSIFGYGNAKFVPKENGWRYQETGGDNMVYIENIVGNFYYYLEEY